MVFSVYLRSEAITIWDFIFEEEPVFMFKKFLYLSGICLLALGTQSQASTIGPSCGSCFGSTYTLSYATTANSDIFNVYLNIDATGYTGASTDVLNAVSLKLVSNGSSISSVNLLSGPAGFSSTILGGISAGGCAANANNGYFCSETSSPLEVGQTGDVYNWEWQVQLTSPGDLLTGTDTASLKASYLTAAGRNAGLMSENITLDPSTPSVPEPTSFVLLGTGLLSAAGFVRRRLSL